MKVHPAETYARWVEVNPSAWGRALIETNDHDPLYSALVDWGVRASRVRRFMVAYWCCYDVGASWFISQSSGKRFWDVLATAAENVEPSPLGERWPRAHERRHWRGQKCVESVEWLRRKFKHPEEAVISLEAARSLGEVQKLMDWPQFGPWIAFKAADMLERVLGVPVEFPREVVTLYKDPKEGANLMGELLGGKTPDEVVDYLLREYGDMVAPGATDRPCGIQEVETVLCKWKSARKGHYWIGKDTFDHRRSLLAWKAQDLLEVYPTVSA